MVVVPRSLMQTSTLDIGIDVALAVVAANGSRLADLPEAVRVVAVVHAAQGIIDNGGLNYFFESDFPDSPPYSLFSECYRRIGAVDEAEVLERAVARFPFPDPHKSSERRNALLNEWDEDLEWNALDAALIGNKNVWSHLEKFIERNLKDFMAQQ